MVWGIGPCGANFHALVWQTACMAPTHNALADLTNIS